VSIADQARKILNHIRNPITREIVEQPEQRASESSVTILDYIYTPKQRASLSVSRIGEILDHWYVENQSAISQAIQDFCSNKENFSRIPFQSSDPLSPCWINEFISPFDATSIYGILASHNPRYYIEVGSGNTTLFANQSIIDNNLRTKIISIDPYPRAEIDSICHSLYRVPFEDMDLDFFKSLTHEDVFLVDNSHRSFPNSDVTVFFTEVLPCLPSGMLYALHDIFLPSDYPPQWSILERRWYNEQYLLCSYILGGANGDSIVFPSHFLGNMASIFNMYNPLWGKGELFENTPFGGVFFWMKKA